MVSSKKKILLAASASQFLAMQSWFSFSAVLPDLNKLLALSARQTGFILAAFQGGYIIGVLFWSILSDRISPQKIMANAALLVAIFGAAFAVFPPSFASTLMLRIFTGISIGGIYVPGMKMLSGIYRPEERGGALGFFVGSLVLGSSFSFIISSQLVISLGWRSIILICAANALLAALIMFIAKYPFTNVPSYRLNLKVIKQIANRPSLLVNTSYVGHNWELYGVWGWIGPYMVSIFLGTGIDFQSAVRDGNLVAGLIIGIGAVASFAGGKLSDRWGRIPIARSMLAVSMLISLVFGWLTSFPAWLSVLLGLVYGFTLVADSPVYSTTLTELNSNAYHGLVLGLQSVTGFTVTVISPLLFGIVFDLINNNTLFMSAAGDYHWGWPFMVLAVGPLVGLFSLQKAQKVLVKSSK